MMMSPKCKNASILLFRATRRVQLGQELVPNEWKANTIESYSLLDRELPPIYPEEGEWLEVARHMEGGKKNERCFYSKQNLQRSVH